MRSFVPSVRLLCAHARKKHFAKYGIDLKDFLINRITPPEEVQKMIDEKSGMAAVGNLNEFMKFMAAKAMVDAAVSGGGMGAGVGLGIGAGVGGRAI